MASPDPDRTASLVAAKLCGLVGDHLGVDPSTLEPIVRAGGAGLVIDGAGWYLPVDDGPRSLGPALAWMTAQGVHDLHLLSERAAGDLGRRAQCFDPAPQVWAVHDRTLRPAEAARSRGDVTPAPTTEEFALLLREAEVDVVVEHGVVTGEVEGLEIARVLVDADARASLEIGVGRHDREAFAMVHGDRSITEALAEVADTVRGHRRQGAAAHPLNRIAASRRLRSFVVREPHRVGAAELVPVAPAVPRDDLRVDVPAPAVGRSTAGAPVAVVASVGIDLDLVPEAADVRELRARGALLRLVLPERDVHARVREQAARLVEPAEIVTVPDDWHLVGP